MHLSYIIALVGATFGLVQATSSSSGNTQPSLTHLQSREIKHHMHNKRHQNIKDIDEGVYPLYSKRGLDTVTFPLEKRSSRNHYDRAMKYMDKARKSYERSQRHNRGSHRGTQSTNYLQNPDRFSRSRQQRPTYNDNARYDQSVGYTGDWGYNGDGRDYTSDSRDYRGYTGGNSNYAYGIDNHGFESPPLPLTGSPPPTPFGTTGGAAAEGGAKEGGGEEGSDSEVKEWGLKDGKIPAGADIEEEDAPDPEQDPSDATDPPIVDGKPVAREE